MTEENEDVGTDATPKKRKKIAKNIDELVLTVTEVATGSEVVIDAAELSEDIQNRLMMHGLSQKLGDAMAGTDKTFEGVEAVAAALKEGTWATRVSGNGAGKAISAAKVKKGLGELSDDEKAASIAMLEKLGIDTSKLQ